MYIQQGFIKLGIVGALIVCKLNCLLGVAVQKSRAHILDVIAPMNPLRTQRGHMLLDEFQQMIDVVFWILKEAHKQLDGAVSRTTADSLHGGIHKGKSVGHGFNGVCKGKILVVMCVEADLLTCALYCRNVFLCKLGGILGVERAIAVYKVDNVNICVGKHIKCLHKLVGIA